MDTTKILSIVQIVVCVILVISILLQNRAEGLGQMFGGGGEIFRTKRGLEKFLYYLTIGMIAVLVITSVVILKLSS
ncbi:MAG TPA: preprotein translocase subunit SecG [Candidatus Dojkabacteria bacterium]|nr:preprotein translocase subunit SecG [Candidatus Dojkabacteria bacterium]